MRKSIAIHRADYLCMHIIKLIHNYVLHTVGEKHILDRCFKVMIDHLGVDMVAIKMMELKLMEPAQALSICNKDSYKSIAERAEAVSSITRVVQDKGPQAFTTFIRILEQTGVSYLSHQKIIQELQQDPSYASYLK